MLGRLRLGTPVCRGLWAEGRSARGGVLGLPVPLKDGEGPVGSHLLAAGQGPGPPACPEPQQFILRGGPTPTSEQMTWGKETQTSAKKTEKGENPRVRARWNRVETGQLRGKEGKHCSPGA